jgi:hypothetical protein
VEDLPTAGDSESSESQGQHIHQHIHQHRSIPGIEKNEKARVRASGRIVFPDQLRVKQEESGGDHSP